MRGKRARERQVPRMSKASRRNVNLLVKLKVDVTKLPRNAPRSEVKRHARVVRELLRQLYPGRGFSVDEVEYLVWEAYKSADDDYGEKEAIEWADGFKFRDGFGECDRIGLEEAGGDLEAYIRLLHSKMSSDGGRRLSRESIERLVPPDDPDYDRLLDLVDGIEILTAESFTPNLKPPPLRRKYVRMAAPVNKLMQQLYDKGFIIVIPTREALKIDGIHFSQTHWALKKGKKYGRPIGDASAEEGDFEALNSDEAKAMADEKWGRIKHPTINELCEMVQVQHDRHGPDKTVLFKMDLRGAFHLLFVRPESTCKLAFALTDDLTMLYHTGMFGWSGMPGAFAVVSRVVERLINQGTRSERAAGFRGSDLWSCRMYVDDLMGACHADELDKVLFRARSIINELLGIGAVEDEKTESGRRLDFIGWNLDLDTMTVTLARRNFLKTLHGFLRVDEDGPVTVRTMQTLASWASRYSLICRSLKPLSVDLYSAVRGYNNPDVRIFLDDDAKRAIRLWRACLIALECDHDGLARPIRSLAPRVADYTIEYDASLSGLGIILSSTPADGSASRLLKVIKVDLPFDLGDDSGYQNTVEFMAVVVGMAGLAAIGVQHAGVCIIGDNTTSLAWGKSELYRSYLGRRSAMCCAAISSVSDLQIVDAIHIQGKRNIVCDRLSRGDSIESMGFSAADLLDWRQSPDMSALVALCNPTRPLTSDASVLQLWGESILIARSLSALE